MKAVVITRHGINNYGSLLQTMATQAAIESLGHTCEIIDYVRPDEEYRTIEKTMLAQKPAWNRHPLKRAIYLLIRQPAGVLSGRRFARLTRRYLHLTRRYATEAELKADKPAADRYITGSDQVWGPVGRGVRDACYCLSFTDEEDRRFSYAASFGHAAFTPETEAFFRKWLTRYDRILVREDSAAAAIRSWGLEAEQVIDPTLLMPGSYWETYMTAAPKKRYLLIYQIHNDPALARYAKRLAKQKGLSLIRVSPSLHQRFRGGKFVWCPDVGAFLSLIRHAACLVTDSFHGTAFAVNLNTPFIEVLPNNDTGTRNESLLRLTGLTDRILTDPEDLGLIDRPIDFERVNRILDSERKRSLSLLNEMLRP